MAASGCAYAPEQDNLEEVLADRFNASDAVPDGGRDEDDAEEVDGGERGDEADDGESAEGEADGPRLDSAEDAVRVSDSDASATGAARDAGRVDAAVPTQGEDASIDGEESSAEAGAEAPAVACLPGSYRGEINGEITSSFSRERIAGTIEIDLVGAGDTLEVASGTIRGTDQDGNALTAKVTGFLDCRTQRLEQGALSDGLYTRPSSLVSTIHFAGDVAATYSSQPAALQGTWTLESALGTRSGSGRFTALRH